ncbi:hypothetical protein L462_00289 [Enterobacter sp. BIDMC 26]|nr:hypothetical protein L462_00289 [Enterobacter sp. BIDMC 26]
MNSSNTTNCGRKNLSLINVHSRHKADRNKSRKVCYQQGMNINNFRS